MKKITFFLMLSLVVAFDILFYKQIPGINVSIFCLLLLTVTLIQKPRLLSDKIWILVAATSILSSVFVGIYGDILSISACLISISLLAAFTNEKKSSIWVAITGCFLSYLRTPLILYKKIKHQITKWQQSNQEHNFTKPIIIGITFLIVLAFFFIYRNSSLLFHNFTQNIQLDFISFLLIIFTLNAILLITAFYSYSPIENLYNILDKPNKYITNTFQKTDNEIKLVSMEQFAGIMLLSSLNVLLLIVNILDITYLVNKQLPQGITYSDYIHQGVGMLILSIVFAVLIILYFFRKDLNFSNNKWLKLFAYFWIIQNLFMIFSNVSRNSMYIEAYGLTEKRIGVYFYLLLAAIGLITTIIKIYKKQTNAFLLRFTSTVFFIILLISCPINWDKIITRHDLSRQDAIVNFNYLNHLSYTNIPLMLDYIDKQITGYIPDLQKNKEDLHIRILNFIMKYNEFPNWQSSSYQRRKIYTSIIQKKITNISVNNINYYHIKAIAYLPNVNELIISNSNLEDFTEWPEIYKINRLTLTNCNITDITFIKMLSQLEYLDISKNKIDNINPLYRLKNLKELHISNISKEKLRILQIMLPETTIILLTNDSSGQINRN